jgi:hypothetical protein
MAVTINATQLAANKREDFIKNAFEDSTDGKRTPKGEAPPRGSPFYGPHAGVQGAISSHR